MNTPFSKSWIVFAIDFLSEHYAEFCDHCMDSELADDIIGWLHDEAHG